MTHQFTMYELETLVKDAKECEKNCHDRGCTRMGYCTGGPGHALEEWHRQKKKHDADKAAEEDEYAAFKRNMDRWHRENK